MVYVMLVFHMLHRILFWRLITLLTHFDLIFAYKWVLALTIKSATLAWQPTRVACKVAPSG